LTIDALFQFRSHLEKRQAFGLDRDHFPAFGVAPLLAIVLFDFERAQPPDLYAVAFNKCVGYVVEKQVDHILGFHPGKPLLLGQLRYQFEFVHACSNRDGQW